MAKWVIPTEEAENEYANWITSRPHSVQKVLLDYNLDPYTLYRLKTTGQIGTLYSITESGTVTMDFDAKYNAHNPAMADRRVFGINPADLEECDLPEGVEPVVNNDEEG